MVKGLVSRWATPGLKFLPFAICLAILVPRQSRSYLPACLLTFSFLFFALTAAPRPSPLILFVSLCKLWCCRRYGTRLHLTVSPGARSLRFVDSTLNAKTSEFYCCFIDGFTCQTSESIAIRKFIWRTRKCLKGIQKIQNSTSSSGEKQFISLRFGT